MSFNYTSNQRVKQRCIACLNDNLESLSTINVIELFLELIAQQLPSCFKDVPIFFCNDCVFQLERFKNFKLSCLNSIDCFEKLNIHQQQQYASNNMAEPDITFIECVDNDIGVQMPLAYIATIPPNQNMLPTNAGYTGILLPPETGLIRPQYVQNLLPQNNNNLMELETTLSGCETLSPLMGTNLFKRRRRNVQKKKVVKRTLQKRNYSEQSDIQKIKQNQPVVRLTKIERSIGNALLSNGIVKDLNVLKEIQSKSLNHAGGQNEKDKLEVEQDPANNGKDLSRRFNHIKDLDFIWCSFCLSDVVDMSMHTHILTTHFVAINKHKLRCNKCGKVLTTRHGAALHFDSHRKFKTPKKCPNCDMTFISIRSYKLHLKLHTETMDHSIFDLQSHHRMVMLQTSNNSNSINDTLNDHSTSSTNIDPLLITDDLENVVPFFDTQKSNTT